MDHRIDVLTNDMKRNGPANDAALAQVLANLDFTLPLDYLEFIKTYNGAEGVVGESYLQLLPVEELKECNTGNETDKYAPGYYIFGSDLGGTAFAFKKTGNQFVAFDVIGMLISDEPEILGNSFLAFLERLSRG